MNLSIVLEARFVSTPDGRVWTQAVFTYPFWHRYLSVFDGVKVVARVKPVKQVDSSYKQVTGEKVAACCVPYYVGPQEYLKRWAGVRRAVAGAVLDSDALLVRVPSALASHAIPEFWRTRRPYGLEVVGDPYDVFAPGIVQHPLRPVIRYLATRMMKRQCARAAAVSYVTRETLQRRYPCTLGYGISDVELGSHCFAWTPKAFRTHFSSVELQSSDYAAGAKTYLGGPEPQIIFIGSLEQKYKGLDVLLRALRRLHERGKNPRLTVIGDGHYRAEMEHLVRNLKLEMAVDFRGALSSGGPIRDELDAANLMVLPSRTEGLPRVILEAMARALPCIGTKVGGIPELLEESELVPPDNVEALASKIEKVLSDPARMNLMSARNLEFSRQYHCDILQARREEFYRVLRARTEEWLATR